MVNIDGSVNAYHILVEGDSILRYQEEVRIRKRKCSSQKIVPIALIGILIVTATIIVITLADHSPELDDDDDDDDIDLVESKIVVKTVCGKVIGERDGGAFGFKGIPYVKPPVNELRWAPPEPLKPSQKCWDEEEFEATEFGPVCPQLDVNSGEVTGSEDCLYLNVWTPSLTPKKLLPVVVWIHGGDLLRGSGHTYALLPNAKLAVQHDIVYVTFNYRIGVLGFLSLSILSKHSSTKTSGNYGILDQIAALHWVQENIRGFGGDPSKVTVVGHGAGASSAIVLVSSMLTKGLFQRIWMTNPATVFNTTIHVANERNVDFLDSTNCTKCSLEELRVLSLDTVVKSTPSRWSKKRVLDLPLHNESAVGMVVIDGYVLPRCPTEMWKSGESNNIPMIIGSSVVINSELIPTSSSSSAWDLSHIKDYVGSRFLEQSVDITKMALKRYNAAAHPEVAVARMVADVRLLCPINQLIGKISKSLNSSIYHYIALTKPSQPIAVTNDNSSISDSHPFWSWDVIAFIDQFVNYIEKPGEDDIAFQKNIQAGCDIHCGFIILEALLSSQRGGRPFRHHIMIQNAAFGSRMAFVDVAGQSSSQESYRS